MSIPLASWTRNGPAQGGKIVAVAVISVFIAFRGAAAASVNKGGAEENLYRGPPGKSFVFPNLPGRQKDHHCWWIEPPPSVGSCRPVPTRVCD